MSMELLSAVVCLAFLFISATNSVPAQPYYYTEQLVDHFSISRATFSQRYYKNDSSFQPNGPIFVIMGGEGAIPPEVGLYYPFILQLAEKFNALVVEPEHRFYGESLPVVPYSIDQLSLLTAEQALADTAQFILFVKSEYKSQNSRVMTIGGSYPAFLSALMRIRYPTIVDFAYAASAPMLFYSQNVNQYDYYRVVTSSAEGASRGCSSAVRQMLVNSLAASSTKDEIVTNLQLCTPLPQYIQNEPITTLINEISMIVMYSFANLNMANYPPPNTSILTACTYIQNSVGKGDYWNALQMFLNEYSLDKLDRTTLRKIHKKEILKNSQKCYNLSLQLPAGHDATISAGDWSGVGTGIDGANWDFETSTLLVEAIGTNGISDMFLPREWDLEWLTTHSQLRFGTTPQPTLLADLWGFQHLDKIGTSHIIFTNGLKDGWSVGGIRNSIPDHQIFVLDMPNGAHHSDLLHEIIANDTEDVLMVHNRVELLLSQWLSGKKGQKN